jgi:hypothetical protein
MLKYILNILNKVPVTEMPISLGRWRRETCSKALNLKIDLSNEDHCGPCGEYSLEKIKSKKIIVELDNKSKV